MIAGCVSCHAPVPDEVEFIWHEQNHDAELWSWTAARSRNDGARRPARAPWNRSGIAMPRVSEIAHCGMRRMLAPADCVSSR